MFDSLKINSYISHLVLILVLCITFFAGAVFFVINYGTVDFSQLTISTQKGKPSIILDDEGKEWTRFQLDKREPISLDQMPTHLIHAFLAAEDWQFFSHGGLSFRGIVRSLLVNIYHGRFVQGASTITQQLVKLLFFDSQKTFRRKIKEQIYSLLIEYQCTKEQILQTYLNNIYFGCGIYGVEAAAQRFWGISAKEISIDQAALLAGIVRSPGNYCPLLCPLSAQRRRNIILNSMRKLNFIDEQQYKDAVLAQADIIEVEEQEVAPHLKEMIRLELEDVIGKKDLYTGGYTVQTTINKSLQLQAQQLFKNNVATLRSQFNMPFDGALISIDHNNGEIKALVGGYDFHSSKFNRALQAKRQLGSIIKPLIYAVAVKKGMNFAQTEIDEPLAINDNGKIWSPNNHDMQFHGSMTLAQALAQSNNIISIKVLLKIGAQEVISIAKKCNFDEPIYPYPSLALGCIDTTLLKATAFFAIFANDGMYRKPYVLRWIKDRWGAKVFNKNSHAQRVIESNIVGQVGRVLELSINRVRKRYNDPIVNSQVICKTGTTNDSRTCWFMGSTPELTTGIYIGCDDNSSMGKNVFPIHTAFPIWRDLYKTLKIEKKQFSYDPSLHEVWIDKKTGEMVTGNQKNAIRILI